MKNMKNNKFFKSTIICTIAAMTLILSCKKDENPVPTPQPPVNEGELITTIKISFVDTANFANKVTAVFSDIDGPGGNNPVIDTIRLQPNKTYLAEILLLDQSKNPIDTISNEIIEEANDHQFFFTQTNTGITVNYADLDSNNPPLPLGISTIWTTTGAFIGKTRITLKHQPGIKNNSITQGDTDIEVDFPVRVK
jgi:hypothetical protein